MAKSKRKQSRHWKPLLFLTAVLLLALAFVLLLPAIRAKFPGKNGASAPYTPTYKTIAVHDPAQLATITVTHADGSAYTLTNQNGTLVLSAAGIDPEPINPMYTEYILQYATAISVEDTVAEHADEVTDSLADMGLAPPQITVETDYADGSTVTIALGYNLADTTYYYYRWSGDDGVYLCNTGVYETFEYTADLLLSITQPTIHASLIESISVARADDEPIVCTFGADGGAAASLQSPYVYPMDPDAADALRSAAENFRLGARLLPVTDENRSAYGLDAPQAVVKIAQREGLDARIDAAGVLTGAPLEPSVITLNIGAKDGDFFYYCEYAGTCYRVSSFLVSAFLDADADALLLLRPADMDGETLQRITVQTGEGTQDFCASYTEKVLPNNELATDEFGNVIYTVDVTRNGEPLSLDAFTALAQRLGQMTVSGTLEALRQPEGTPVWQMTLTTVKGAARSLAAYPLDAFQYLLSVDGVALCQINKEALEIALGEFAALPVPAETKPL